MLLLGTVNTNQPKTDPVAPQYQFNQHDIEVIGIQVIIAMLIAGISYIANLHFGAYSPLVYSLAMAIAEALRRYVV